MTALSEFLAAIPTRMPFSAKSLAQLGADFRDATDNKCDILYGRPSVTTFGLRHCPHAMMLVTDTTWNGMAQGWGG